MSKRMCKKKMPKTRLTYTEILILANQLAKSYNLKLPSRQKQRIALRYGFPTIYSNDEVQMWVDKYYIAHSRTDETNVHYKYIAMRHILEEAKNYMPFEIPESIRDSHEMGRNQMIRSGKQFHVF